MKQIQTILGITIESSSPNLPAGPIGSAGPVTYFVNNHQVDFADVTTVNHGNRTETHITIISQQQANVQRSSM